MNGPVSPDIAHKRTADSSLRSAVLDFDPARDGLGFANVFTWTEADLDTLTEELKPLLAGVSTGLPLFLGHRVAGIMGLATGTALGVLLATSEAPRWLIQRLAIRWSTFGLCGGMALLAIERWELRDAEPTSALRRDDVRPILRLRQAKTIRASWSKFLKFWMQAHTTEGVHAPESLASEVRRVREQIDAGRPVLLGLVGNAPDPFAMHQVVAFGYADGPSGLDILVYDPNGPGQTRHVVIRKKAGKMTIETDLPTGPKKGGGYHISKGVGVLSAVFVIDV